MTLIIGFDADDTLWHNETLFAEIHERFRQRLSQYHDPAIVDKTLYQTEMQNLDLFGYGIKAFALSAIETAIQLTSGRIPSEEILSLIEQAKRMLQHPVELLEGVADTLALLADQHDLVVITKGDLRDQERKILRSGLAGHLRSWEIVSEKTSDSYQRVLQRLGIPPEQFLMVGNSLRSDIVPVLEIGAHAAHLPYPITWEHERISTPPLHHRFHELGSIRELPALVGRLRANWNAPSR